MSERTDQKSRRQSRPNIVVIMADDLGSSNRHLFEQSRNTRRATRVVLLAVMVAGVLCQAGAAEAPAVRVAYVYSGWPDGKAWGKTNHPDFTSNAGWSCDAFETPAIGDLIERIGDYDLVVLGWTFNLDFANVVDLSVHREKWMGYLERGGVILVTNAVYKQHIDWLARVDPSLHVEVGEVIEIPRVPAPWRQTERQDMRALSQAACLVTPWKGLGKVAAEWTVVAKGADGQPLVLLQEIGKGVIVVSACYQGYGFPDRQWLADLMTFARDKDRRGRATEAYAARVRKAGDPELARRMSLARELAVPRAASAPTIDGKLDDACWSAAAVGKDFVVVGGKRLPSEETEARIAFDDSNLYVGFICHNRAGRELRALARKPPGGSGDAVGAIWWDDSIELFLDSAGGGETYFQIIVNSRGARFDLAGLDPAWNGVYDVATRVDEAQWTAELAIPFATLEAGGPGSASTWGANFCRSIGGEQGEKQGEAGSWFPVPLSFQSAAHMGKLTGLAPDAEGLSVAMDVTPPETAWVGVNRMKVHLAHKGSKPFEGAVVLEAGDLAGGRQEQRVPVTLAPGDEAEVAPEIRLEEKIESSCIVKLVRESDGHLAAVTRVVTLAPPELFVFQVAEPSYRATVFPSMNRKEVLFGATVGLDPVSRKGCKVAATVWDTLEERKIDVAPVEVSGSKAVLRMSIEGLPADSYRVFGKLLDAGGGTLAVRQSWFTILRPVEEGKEVWVDEEGALRVNGKPFFPIMTSHALGHWMERINGKLAEEGLAPMDARRICGALRELGLNTVHGAAHDRREYDLAAEAGLYVVTGQITGFDTPLDRIGTIVGNLRGHAALLGYYGIDEVTQVHRGQSREAGIVVRALDPYHPYITSLAVPAEAAWLSQEHDVLMPDSYPVDTHPLTQVASMMDATRSQMVRSAPLWFYVQGWAYTGRTPTDDEMRVMAYLALNHGAKGLNLFSFCNRFLQAPTKGALTDFAGDAFWAGWRRVARESAALAEVWLAGESSRRDVTADKRFIDIMAKAIGGTLTVVAINPTTQAGDIEIALPLGKWSAKGEVVFEDRQVSQTAGTFTDHFERHSVHVYRFR